MELYEIYKMEYENGMSLTKIGKKYGTSRNTVGEKLKKLGVNVINRHNAPKFNQFYFDELNAENCYWLGFLYADGWVSKNTNAISLELSSKDDSHVELFSKHLKNKGKIIYEKHRTRLYLCNKYTHAQLVRLGCLPNKSLILKYCSNIPEKYHYNFIRGYFDGDGHIVSNLKASSIQLLGTKEFLNWIATKFNVNHTITKDKRHSGNTFGLNYTGLSARSVLTSLYDNSNLHLNRKLELAKMHLNKSWRVYKQHYYPLPSIGESR